MASLFQFGNFPELSQAEIHACGLAASGDFVAEHFYRTEEEVPRESIEELGGTMRIGTLLSAAPYPENIANWLDQEFPSGKIRFALWTEKDRERKNLLLGVKKALKKKGRSSIFANRDFRNMDSFTLHQEKKVCELMIVGKLLAETIAVQNPEELSKRDFKKPVRDMKVGMLPPKLALMLINLVRRDKQLPKALLDPFCGTGTVLIEALRLGILTVSGSDLSPTMLEASKKNTAHFFPNASVSIASHDATKPLFLDKKTSIVTEGYLGPIYKKPLVPEEEREAREDVEKVMTPFLEHASQENKIQEMVLCLPFWKVRGGYGFTKKTLAIIEKFWDNSAAQNPLGRRSFLFRRPNQMVGREIFVLRKR